MYRVDKCPVRSSSCQVSTIETSVPGCLNATNQSVTIQLGKLQEHFREKTKQNPFKSLENILFSLKFNWQWCVRVTVWLTSKVVV